MSTPDHFLINPLIYQTLVRRVYLHQIWHLGKLRQALELPLSELVRLHNCSISSYSYVL